MGERAAVLVSKLDCNHGTRGILAAEFAAIHGEPLVFLEANGREAAIFEERKMSSVEVALANIGLIHGNGVKLKGMNEELKDMMRGEEPVATINRPVADGDRPGIVGAKNVVSIVEGVGEPTRFYVIGGETVMAGRGEKGSREWLDPDKTPGQDLARQVMMSMARVMGVGEVELVLGVDIAETDQGLAVAGVTHEPTRIVPGDNSPSNPARVILHSEALVMSELLQARAEA